MAADGSIRRLRHPEGELPVGAVMAVAAVTDVKGLELDRGRPGVVATLRLEDGVQPPTTRAHMPPVVPVDVRDPAARVSSVIEVARLDGSEAIAVGCELLRAKHHA